MAANGVPWRQYTTRNHYRRRSLQASQALSTTRDVPMGPPSSCAIGTDSTHEMALRRTAVFFPNTALTPHLLIPRTSGIQLRHLCPRCCKACGWWGREWSDSSGRRRGQICLRQQATGTCFPDASSQHIACAVLVFHWRSPVQRVIISKFLYQFIASPRCHRNEATAAFRSMTHGRNFIRHGPLGRRLP